MSNRKQIISAIIFVCMLAVHTNAQLPTSFNSRFSFDAAPQSHSNLRSLLPGIDADTTSKWAIVPLVNFNAGYGNRALSLSQGGAGVRWRPNNRWCVQGGYALWAGLLPDYLERFVNENHFTAGMGYAVADARPHLYHTHYSYGNVTYRPGKHFTFEFGKSAHHWGDGYRSLILSLNPSPAPYAKISTSIGKLRYENLWMQLRDISKGQPLSQSRYKFAAMHALSYQITPRLNASLYEWVIWQNSDTLSHRGLDLYYLNPLVFYRPVEYSLGSPDNVLLAGSLKWNVTESLQFYGQFVLDEFNLKLFRKGEQWWGNKIAGQAGLKWNTPVDGLHVLSEVNIARPFIYTHGSSVQAWTHINQPMAHPLGANFMESCNRISYARHVWRASEQLNVAAFGRDYDADGDGLTDNFGGNITHSYVNPYGGSFGHEILQGNLHQTVYHSFFIGRALSEKSRWEVYVQHTLRAEKADGVVHSDNWLMLGIQTRGMLQPVQDY